MNASKVPSRTVDKYDLSTRIIPGQKAFSLFTRRSNHRPIHGFRLSGGSGSLAERPFEVGVALAGLTASLDGPGLDGARAQFRPRHQVRGGGEPAHVQPDLGEDDLRPGRPDAGDFGETLHDREVRGWL